MQGGEQEPPEQSGVSGCSDLCKALAHYPAVLSGATVSTENTVEHLSLGVTIILISRASCSFLDFPRDVRTTI